MDGRVQAPSLLYTVKQLELVVRARLDDMLRGSGVTTPQYTALTVLAHRDGISAAQLARDSFVTPQSMAEMLRLLERRGLVRRSPNPASRRELRVHLTDEGRALMASYDDALAALERELTDGLTAAEVAAFRRTVATLWDSARP